MFTLRKSMLRGVPALLLSVCILSVTNVEASADSSGYLKGSNVNIRADHTTSSKSLGVLSNQNVTILGTSGEWFKISDGTIIGWVKDDFVIRKAQPQTTTRRLSNVQTTNNASIDGTNVNIRSKPTTTSKVLAKLSNTSVKILSTSGNWYKISFNGNEGWVTKDFITLKNSLSSTQQVQTKKEEKQPQKVSQVLKTGIIDGTNVNLRSKPTKTATVTHKVSNEKVNILAQSGDWYKVSTGKTTGWISEDFVKISSNQKSTTTKTVAKTEQTSSQPQRVSSSVRKNLVVFSRGLLGVRYKWGGTSPSGFDCSGFTSYVYKNFGINIDRVSTDQAKQGVYVPKNKLQPGDLVFFDTNGGNNKNVNHAGIYIGNSKFIHASSSRTGKIVRISSLNESFYSKAYVTGRKFVK